MNEGSKEKNRELQKVPIRLGDFVLYTLGGESIECLIDGAAQWTIEKSINSDPYFPV